MLLFEYVKTCATGCSLCKAWPNSELLGVAQIAEEVACQRAGGRRGHTILVGGGAAACPTRERRHAAKAV